MSDKGMKEDKTIKQEEKENGYCTGIVRDCAQAEHAPSSDDQPVHLDKETMERMGGVDKGRMKMMS